MKKYLVIILLASMVGCLSVDKTGKKQITVSIAPLSWVVEGLVDSSITVNILVPPGVSPETYEPSARQVEDLKLSEILFSIGLIDFEHQIEDRLREVAPQTTYVRLADSLSLIHGSCGDEGHNHAGVDPHIWLSPTMMRQITFHIASVLIGNNVGDSSSIYHKRDSLIRLIDELDNDIRRNLRSSNNRTFAIVHPSLGYFANDYDLQQVAIEIDGKEPSGLTIKALVDTLNKHKIKTIIYSEQNPATAAKVIASEIGGSIEKFDPVSKDWFNNMRLITTIICKTNSSK